MLGPLQSGKVRWGALAARLRPCLTRRRGEAYGPASENERYTEGDGRERLKVCSGARAGWGLRARFRKRALHRGRRPGAVERVLRREDGVWRTARFGKRALQVPEDRDCRWVRSAEMARLRVRARNAIR